MQSWNASQEKLQISYRLLYALTPQKIQNLNPLDYKEWGIMQESMCQKKSKMSMCSASVSLNHGRSRPLASTCYI